MVLWTQQTVKSILKCTDRVSHCCYYMGGWRRAISGSTNYPFWQIDTK